MLSFTEWFAVFIMLLIIIMYVQNRYNEVEYVVSALDQRRYLVRKLPDSRKAADLLASINADLTKLTHHLLAKFSKDASVRKLFDNFNPSAVSEGSIESGYTSYSVNKGEKIILCIRQRDNSFVEKNVLLYVAIHEIAHIMTTEIGHTTLFWSNFRFILKEAIDVGVYKKVDFDKKPEDYCGIKISSSVL